MLIRVDGREDGVKQYLEHGRKVGREHTRDQLDERVILAGNLDLVDAVVQSIPMREGTARYLSITMSFKEEHIEPETLNAIVREFEAFVFGQAYKPGEYCFYAEAHLPRIKSYIDQKTGDLVERKPHIHVVIPKLNLITGGHLEPLGYVKSNLAFIDAFQESVNARFGLASPKDHRRIEITDASEMISRYSGDQFGQAHRDFKERLLDEILTRDIRSEQDFRKLLAEHGVSRQRNAGRDDAYFNVKPFGAAKGINLKEYVFSPAFLERSAEQKALELKAQLQHDYTESGVPREVPQAVAQTLQTWRDSRALEVKYLANGQALDRHRALSSEQQQQVLQHLHRDFYKRHQPNQEALHGHDATDPADNHDHDHDHDHDTVPVPEPGRPDDRRPGLGHAFPFKRPAVERVDPSADPSGDRESGPAADWPAPITTPGDGLRDLPGLDVVRRPGAAAVLVPGDERRGVEHPTTGTADPLRRPDDRAATVAPHANRPAASATTRTGRCADTSIEQLARDQRQSQISRREASQPDIKHIRRTLDARRLLAELSHSHGLIPEKYEVSQAEDGSPRIHAGRQRLNVGDFLTRELRLPWQEAAAILRACHARQVRGDEPTRPRELPRAELWRAFVPERQAVATERRQAWEAQRASEHSRRARIKTDFLAARTQATADRSRTRPERKAALSGARLHRAFAQTALRAAITRERQALRDLPVLTFQAFLQRRAEAGDERALAELRRTQVPLSTPSSGVVGVIRSGDHQQAQNEILWHASGLTREVESGGSVTYRRDGVDAIRDQADSVLVLQRDPELIEAALRLAQARFGRTLQLDGPPDFQAMAAAVAADAGLQVMFSAAGLNDQVNARRAELLAQRLGPAGLQGPVTGRPSTSSTPSEAAQRPADEAVPQPKGPRL